MLTPVNNNRKIFSAWQSHACADNIERMKQIAMTVCVTIVSATWALGQSVVPDGFKGLCLRMTQQQVAELASNTQWGVTAKDASEWKLFPGRVPDATFPVMAVTGGVTQEVSEADVSFFSNRVESVRIYSPVSSATGLRLWCSDAADGLVRRYGPPSETFSKIENIDQGHILLYAKPSMAIYGWETKTSAIILAIIEEAGNYRAAIQYSDNALSAENSKAVSKSDFNAL